MKITEMLPDEQNANRGTERGSKALENSIQKYGLGRSILIDKNGKVIAGNKTLEKAGELGFEDIEVVKTEGNKLVAVQRTDLDLNEDQMARELAYADNRVSEVDLVWDAGQLAKDLEKGIDLSLFFSNQELEKHFASIETELDVGESYTSDPSIESDEYEDYPPPSHVRQVQLFFNTETVEKFMARVMDLKDYYKTDTISETVFKHMMDAGWQKNTDS